MRGRQRDTSKDYLCDPRVVELAEDLIQAPPGLIREGLVAKLAEAMQRAMEEWFRDLEQIAR